MLSGFIRGIWACRNHDDISDDTGWPWNRRDSRLDNNRQQKAEIQEKVDSFNNQLKNFEAVPEDKRGMSFYTVVIDYNMDVQDFKKEIINAHSLKNGKWVNWYTSAAWLDFQPDCVSFYQESK